MGKQINFYRNKEIEQKLLSECSQMGLLRFDRDSGPFFAYIDPTDNWLDSDSIQYSSSKGSDLFQGRFWTGSMNPEFVKVFDKLRQFIRSKSCFHKESSLWVWKTYRDEFDDYYSKAQNELNDLVRKNKE